MINLLDILNEVIINKPILFPKDKNWACWVNNSEQYEKIAKILDKLEYKWYASDYKIISDYNPYKSSVSNINNPIIFIHETSEPNEVWGYSELKDYEENLDNYNIDLNNGKKYILLNFPENVNFKNINEIIINKPTLFLKNIKWGYIVKNLKDWYDVAYDLEERGYKWIDNDSIINFNPYEHGGVVKNEEFLITNTSDGKIQYSYRDYMDREIKSGDYKILNNTK